MLSGRAAMILLAAVAVAGCGQSKKQEIAEFTKADAAVAAPPVPTHYELDTPDAKVRLILPSGIDRYGELHAKLYADGRQELLDFVKTAAQDRARFAAKGKAEPTPYEHRVAWTITAISPHLISLRAAWYDDTGGVHPNHGTKILLWDRQRNVAVLLSDLIKPGADTSLQDAALCEAVTRAKAARMGHTDPTSWRCPKWSDGRAVLIPSATPYRIGGMMFLFDPYVIGAYAEGDYEVLMPLSEFQPVLAEGWAGDFTGSPSPAFKSK